MDIEVNEKFDSFLKHMRSSGYNIKIAFKNESFLMKVVGFLLFFNRRFMTSFISTLGHTVYFPSKEWLEKNKHIAHKILAHEIVHIHDRDIMNKKFGFITYSLLYLFPQILSLFSLLSFLAFINFNWIFCLLFLIFLVPIPAPGRYYIEVSGYAMTMFFKSLYVTYSGGTYDPKRHATDLSQYFTNSDYYFMWPFHDRVVTMLVDHYNMTPSLSPVFKDVQIWFQNYYGE